MRTTEKLRWCAAVGAAVGLLVGASAQAQCAGDCDGDGAVSIGELITAVNVALSRVEVSACAAADVDGSGGVAINELISAVNSALRGCPAGCDNCDDGNPCTDDVCEGSECVNDPIVCQDDGNECTAEACAMASGCVSSNVADGSECGGGLGTCQAGVCEMPQANLEYEQDFESLGLEDPEALQSEGWMVFGNVFNGENGSYMYGYGAFPAPNSSAPGVPAAFSAIAGGEGGAEQGSQQLSIFNDYNNDDHAGGHRIESNVFRERRITEDDVSNTLTFSFDAKRGNINDPTDPLCPCESTAFAFIKTLDPGAGFSTTNLVQQETTAISDTWARYSISLAIESDLVGQVLQVGFVTNATLFQPSGVFYDNVEAGSLPTGGP